MMHASEWRHATHSGWTIVVRPLPHLGPLPLGYLVRLEEGPYIWSPAVWLGITWWWRLTEGRAIAKGFAETRKAPPRTPPRGQPRR